VHKELQAQAQAHEGIIIHKVDVELEIKFTALCGGSCRLRAHVRHWGTRVGTVSWREEWERDGISRVNR